jgi:hypothetical protein
MRLPPVVRRLVAAVRYRVSRRPATEIRTVRPERMGRPSFRSGGGLDGRPDLTPCPGCHGHTSHFGDCVYRVIPMSDITSLTMSPAELTRLLDRRLADEDN